MIPGGSNDERLTNVDTHNCYICKVAQYLASHEALLCAFMHVLVVYVHTLQIDFGFKIINAHFAHSATAITCMPIVTVLLKCCKIKI